MKLKLDENLGCRGQRVLTEGGHDVSTVSHQRLGGATDHELIAVCRKEGRGLITLDLDFANPQNFPPSQYPGIAILQPSRKPSTEDIYDVVKTLVTGLKGQDLVGKLWIVEKGRIRVYQEINEP